MGRHFEVRAAAMAASSKKKSAVYMRASKEIYIAAKSGVPDPNNNLALRSAIDKFRKTCPKDVIDRAIKKAQGSTGETYIPGRYEAFGPAGSYIIVDTLTDNVNRALTDVRTAITKKGGHMGTVSFNFTEYGVISFAGNNKDEVEENLIMNDVDVQEVSGENDNVEVLVSPTDLAKAKDCLKDMGILDFDTCEIAMLPNETISIPEGEDKDKFVEMLDMLDEVEDVQNVYHNVEL